MSMFGTGDEMTKARRKVAASNLKRCPLCDALNSTQNQECFACTWHGEFNHDPLAIEEGLRLLLKKCPELRAQNPRPKFTPRATLPKWRYLLRKVLGQGPLDYSV